MIDTPKPESIEEFKKSFSHLDCLLHAGACRKLINHTSLTAPFSGAKIIDIPFNFHYIDTIID